MTVFGKIIIKYEKNAPPTLDLAANLAPFERLVRRLEL